MLCLFQGEVRGVNARANLLNPNRDKIYSRFCSGFKNILLFKENYCGSYMSNIGSVLWSISN